MEYKRVTQGRITKDNVVLIRNEYNDIIISQDAWDMFANAYNRLAELEDKIEQGKMIELPCKVGDTVWCIDGFCDGSFSVAERTVTGFTIERERILLCAVLNDLVLFTRKYDIINIGKSVFFAREEAEKRAKELQNG